MVYHLTETDGSGAFHTGTERSYRKAFEKTRGTVDEESGFPSRLAEKDEAALFHPKLGDPKFLFEKLKKSQHLKSAGQCHWGTTSEGF